MGRRPKAAIEANAPLFKNVFAQLFGTYLKKQRLNLKLGFEQMSEAVGVSGSFYRYLESGGTLFNPTRAYSLLDVFPDIEWEPLIKFLVAGQMLDAGMGSWKELEVLTKRIAERDPQLKKLIIPLNLIWNLNPTNQQKEIDLIVESDDMFFEFNQYLQHNKYYELNDSKKIDAKILDLIYNSSSLFLNHTLNSLEDLLILPAAVLQEDMNRWEIINKGKLDEVFLFTRDTKVLFSEKNLLQYKYDILYSKNFKKLNYLFVSNEDSEILKEKFIFGLINYSKVPKDIVNRFKEKMFFKCIPENASTKNLIDSLIIDKIEFNSYWIWKMTNERYIGFCSHIVMDDIEPANFWKIPIRHLTVQQVFYRIKIIEEYCTNII